MRTGTDQLTHVIRADAFQGLGTGHIMRSLALAQEFIARGDKVTFVTHCEYPLIVERLKEEGVEVFLLSGHYPDDGDLRALGDVIARIGHLGAVVIDGYHFDGAYHSAVRELGAKTLVVDDFHHLASYGSDMLLNQNVSAGSIQYDFPADRLLMGTKFALIRKEFHQRGRPSAHSDSVKSILITMGGEDIHNVTLKVLTALTNINAKAFVSIIAGAANPNLESLNAAIERSSSDVTLLHSVHDMAKVLERTDMCISAGGSTCWELCLYGIPFILVATADNQLGIARDLDKNGAAIYAGWHEDVTVDELERLCAGLLDSPARRNELSLNARELVDGNGASRVVDSIYSTLLI